MPNWCYQHMTVVGSKKDLTAFAKDCWLVVQKEKKETNEKGEEITVLTVNEGWSLNHLDPIPTELTETTAGWGGSEEEQKKQEEQEKANVAKYGYKNWYDYANSVWGSKWGASEVDFQSEASEKGKVELEPHGKSNQIRIYIESAWSPPIGLYLRISLKYPNLVFGITFTEEANFFAGWTIIHAGQILNEGSVSTDQPAELDVMYEKAKGDEENKENDELMHEYYEAVNEWQNDIVDKCDSGLEVALVDVVAYARSNAKRKEKVTYREWEDEQLDKS